MYIKKEQLENGNKIKTTSLTSEINQRHFLGFGKSKNERKIKKRKKNKKRHETSKQLQKQKNGQILNKSNPPVLSYSVCPRPFGLETNLKRPFTNQNHIGTTRRQIQISRS